MPHERRVHVQGASLVQTIKNLWESSSSSCFTWSRVSGPVQGLDESNTYHVSNTGALGVYSRDGRTFKGYVPGIPEELYYYPELVQVSIFRTKDR